MRAEAWGAHGDWLDRLYDGLPLPPVAVGALLGLAVVTLFVGVAAVTGDLALLWQQPDLLRVRDVRLGLTLTLLAGYVPTAQRILELAAQRHRAAISGRTGASPAPGRRSTALVWLLLVPAVALAIDRDPGLYLRADYWSAGTLWTWSTGIFFAWSAGRMAQATWASAQGLAETAAALRRIDLFDRGWLAPFTRQGLVCALLWLGVAAIFALNLGDEPFLYVVTPLTLLCAAVGSIALLRPAVAIRARLRQAREGELARVHAALRGDETALRGSEIAAWADRVSLADLLAYEASLRELSTSPFAAGAWLRLALYLALPLGSWLGGALVERLLASLLGPEAG